MIRALVLAVTVVTACGSVAAKPTPPPAGAVLETVSAIGIDDVILPPIDQYNYAVSPRPMPTASASDVERGWTRITSSTGGWTLDVPETWIAQESWLRGAVASSFDPRGMANDGNIPPPGGVRVRVELARRDPNLDLRSFAERYFPNGGGPIMDRSAGTVHGARAEVRVVKPNMPGGFDIPHLHLLVDAPRFPDRVVAVNAWPVDVADRDSVAWRVARTLRLIDPVSGPATPLLSRGEVIQQGSPGKPTPTPARIEAKLVLLKDLEVRFGSATITHDPDTPVWIVVEFGDFEPAGRATARGPAGAVPARWTWRFRVVDARARTGLSGGGGPAGTEPTWWSALRDRAP